LSNYESYDEIFTVLTSCTNFSNKFFLFKDKEFDLNSSKHFYISIPIRKNEYILLVMFSSQVKKVIRRYELIGKGKDSLVFFEKNDLDFLTRDNSVVDCNNPTYCTCEKLASKIDGKLSIIETKIDERIIIDLKSAIKRSPNVKNAIKNKFS